MKKNPETFLFGALALGAVYWLVKPEKAGARLPDVLQPFASSPTQGQGQTYHVGQTVLLEVYGSKAGLFGFGSVADLSQRRTVTAILAQEQASGSGFTATILTSDSPDFSIGSTAQQAITPSVIRQAITP